MFVINLPVIVLNYDSNTTAAKALDDLIDIRLLREENQAWIEKAVITRLWVGTSDTLADNVLEQLQEILHMISGSTQNTLSASATHAAQVVSVR
jgi:hypothetical protein